MCNGVCRFCQLQHASFQSLDRSVRFDVLFLQQRYKQLQQLQVRLGCGVHVTAFGGQKLGQCVWGCVSGKGSVNRLGPIHIDYIDCIDCID